MLSLRLVSVLICVFLTLVTAVLTIAVSLSFTKKAVDDLGLRFSSALATNLKHSVEGFVQTAAEQYSALAQTTSLYSLGPPNTTWTPGWNGSFWTFDAADFAQLDRYITPLVALLATQNHSRDAFGTICFIDGTRVQPQQPIPVTSAVIAANLPISRPGTMFELNLVAGNGLPPIPTPRLAFQAIRSYGSQNELLASTPSSVPYPTPWSMPTTSCSAAQACSTLDCRTRPQFTSGAPYGNRKCWWLAPFISTSYTAVIGVYCTMYNSLGQRMGVAGSVMLLDSVSAFVSTIERTTNGQAFAIDSINWGLLGSTFPKLFQQSWIWGNATFTAATNTMRNSTSLPIGFEPIPPTAARFTDVGAVSANATVVTVKPNCLVGTLVRYVVCQETVFSYGYQPLAVLHDEVGLDPTAGFRHGVLTAADESYYYALDGIWTTAYGQRVPGLLWAVAILTPHSDVLDKVNSGRTYSIIATACFFVFAASCCFVLFTIFLRPLADLEDKMLLTSNLADENDTEESLSSLVEIRNMQTSFYKLRGQLRKLKSYVPQSVLAAIDNEDDEEHLGETGEPEATTGREELGTVRTETLTQQQRSDQRSQTPSSRESRKSSNRRTVSSGGHVVRALNIQLGLQKKLVTVMVLNVIGLHKQMKSRSAEEFMRLHSRLVESFQSLVAREKGVVDGFQGDRFVATFNAVTNNAQHGVRACVAAAEVLAKLKGVVERAGVGVATGEALVGNAGTETLRRFCTVGRVFTHATVLERMTKQHPSADVVVSSGTATQVRHEFYVEALDLLSFEGASKPTLIYALRARMSHTLEEWNYAMLQNQAKDRYSAANEAFTRFAEGDPAAARGLLSGVADADRALPGCQRLTALLQSNTVPSDYAAVAQGTFFAASYGER